MAATAVEQMPRTGRSVARMIGVGTIAGMVGAIAMAMYAMIAAATYQKTGFYTPMYHIASLIIGPQYMMTSMKHAMAGQLFSFTAGPAALGMAIHLAVGMIFGAVFGLVAWATKLPRAAMVAAGIVYGLLILVLDGFVLLPAAAAVFGAGSAISDMAKIVGLGTFTLEHAIYGLGLGLTLAVLAGTTTERAARTDVDTIGERRAA
jgi:hypothetical protein